MHLGEWSRRTWAALASQETYTGKHYSRADVDVCLRAALDELLNELVAGGQLKLSDLGQLTCEEQEPYIVNSNLPGREGKYQVKGRRVVQFKPSKFLKRLLNAD